MAKVLAVQQPWAYCIVRGLKDIENRTWATRYRGRLYIMASAHRATKADIQYAAGLALTKAQHIPSRAHEYEQGGIVGHVRLVDCVRRDSSVWCQNQDGNYCWILRDQTVIPFIPMKGRLGIFTVPDELFLRI
jgi:hypothetical protein